MSETLEAFGRRVDSLQNNVSAMNRRLITLESNLAEKWVHWKPGLKIALIKCLIASVHWRRA